MADKRKAERNKINKDNAGYFFIAPYFIVFLTFTLYPILYTFKLSFMSWGTIFLGNSSL